MPRIYNFQISKVCSTTRVHIQVRCSAVAGMASVGFESWLRDNKQLVVFSLLMFSYNRKVNFFCQGVRRITFWLDPERGMKCPLLASEFLPAITVSPPPQLLVICSSGVPILFLPLHKTRPQLYSPLPRSQHLHVLGCIMFC